MYFFFCYMLDNSQTNIIKRIMIILNINLHEINYEYIDKIEQMKK